MIPLLLAAARVAAPMIGRAVAGGAAEAGAGKLASNIAGKAATGVVNSAADKYESRKENLDQGMSN